MGLSGIGFWEVFVILLVVFLIFGCKRLVGIGSDLGAAIRDFRKALADGSTPEPRTPTAGGDTPPRGIIQPHPTPDRTRRRRFRPA